MGTTNDTISKQRSTEKDVEDFPFGNPGCQCIDVAHALRRFGTLKCSLEDGSDGVPVPTSGVCIPFSYGSGGCLPYDNMTKPVGSHPGLSWCYVERRTCKKSSREGGGGEELFLSRYFPDLKLFYSYTTCGNAAAQDWASRASIVSVKERSGLSGRSLLAAVPDYRIPFHYKLDGATQRPIMVEGGPAANSSEYYDNSVPFHGVSIDFFNSLVRISDGDFNMNYTYGSRARRQHRQLHNNFNATVQDIQDGLVDIGVGPFWITEERLKMATFTVTVGTDRIMLLTNTDSMPKTSVVLLDAMGKVFDPFERPVWIAIFLVILSAAILGVWFTDGKRNLRQAKHPERRKRTAYARVMLDEFLNKGRFCCSGGVEQDHGAGLPHKILLIGFSFFILIVLSAYVANLASFLTNTPLAVSIETMEEAINQNQKICIDEFIMQEAASLHPDALFISVPYSGELDFFDERQCHMIALGSQQISNIALMNELCERHLVYTDEVIIEYDIAFPIRPEFAKGMSYRMYQAEKSHGISFQQSVDAYTETRRKPCPIMLSELREEDKEFANIDVINLGFPILAFLCLVVLAVVAQIINMRAIKGGGRSHTGRLSRLPLGNRTMNRPAVPNSDSLSNEDDERRIGSKSRASTRAQARVHFAEDSALMDGAHVTGAEQALTCEEEGATAQILDDFVARYNGIKNCQRRRSRII